MTHGPPEGGFRATGPFPRSDRLQKTWQFKRVYHRGFHASSGLFGCYVLPTRRGRPRLGISVSRKFGRAHERNRMKRQIRAAFRLERGRIPGPVDLVLVPRRAARGQPYAVIVEQMHALIDRALSERKRRRR